jgi:MraZ protein
MSDNDLSVPSFHGKFLRGIDDSRRVMMPSDWKPKDPTLVFKVIAWPLKTKEYLLVLPPERWRVMLDKLKSKSLSDSHVAVFERVLGVNSGSLTLDKVGRFCLPEELAEKVGLKKDAQLVGRLDKFEIWNPERYAAGQAAEEAVAAEVADGLDL